MEPRTTGGAPAPSRMTVLIVTLVVLGALVLAFAWRPSVDGGDAALPSAAGSLNSDAPVASASPASAGASAAASPSTDASRPPPATGPSAGYLTSLDELRERAALARAGVEPFASAVDDLINWADDALDHDPDPAESLRIKGTDGPFFDDATAAYGLALAFGVSGDERYAAHSRDLILAWVETTTKLRNACPDGGECQTSLIVARVVAGFVFAADLLEQGDAWDASDRAALSSWLAELILPILPVLPNNWGDAGNFAEIAITDYIGDESGFDAAVKRWRDRLAGIAADGHLPEETRRGDNGIMYTQEALVYKVAIPAIVERRGIDLWDEVNAQGVGLRDALDYLVRYWNEPQDWPWDDRANVPSPGPLWEIAFAQWCDARYLEIARDRRPYGSEGNSAVLWTTLTSATAGDACHN